MKRDPVSNANKIKYEGEGHLIGTKMELEFVLKETQNNTDHLSVNVST